MDDPTVRQMYAKAVGELALQYVELVFESFEPDAINHRAIGLITRIKEILDDDKLDDPHCFLRIEAIVDAFCDEGISTTRHDWG